MLAPVGFNSRIGVSKTKYYILQIISKSGNAQENPFTFSKINAFGWTLVWLGLQKETYRGNLGQLYVFTEEKAGKVVHRATRSISEREDKSKSQCLRKRLFSSKLYVMIYACLFSSTKATCSKPAISKPLQAPQVPLVKYFERFHAIFSMSKSGFQYWPAIVFSSYVQLPAHIFQTTLYQGVKHPNQIWLA